MNRAVNRIYHKYHLSSWGTVVMVVACVFLVSLEIGPLDIKPVCFRCGSVVMADLLLQREERA